ncbi:hypothetical protein [Streptomyces sp. NPDC058092]
MQLDDGDAGITAVGERPKGTTTGGAAVNDYAYTPRAPAPRPSPGS